MTQINTHFIMLMGSVCQELGRAQLDGFSAGASAGKTQVIPVTAMAGAGILQKLLHLQVWCLKWWGTDGTVNWGAYREPVCKAWVSSQHRSIRVAAVYLVVEDPMSERFSKQDLPQPRLRSHIASFLLYSMEALQDQLDSKGADIDPTS